MVLAYFFVSATQTSVAQVLSKSAEKGYDRYDKKEYKEAWTYFRDALMVNEADILANYGMALLYSNSSFQLDYFKAFHSIRKTKDDLKNLKDGDIADLNKLIPDVRGTVAKEWEVIERKLVETLNEKPNTDNLKRFVVEFPDSRSWKDMFRKLNHEYFVTKIRESKKVTVYNQFIEQFQDAEDLQEAILLRNLTAYNDLRSALKLESVYDYLNRYPNSEQLGEVMLLRDSMEFEKTVKVGTIAAYMDFIKHYPNARQIEKAINNYIQLDWDEAQSKSEKEIQDFIYRYYSSDQGQIALQFRDNYMFEKAKTTNTVDAYDKFITYFQRNTQNLSEAIKLRNQKAFENAKGFNTTDALDDFIYKYPFAAQVKEASELRDTIVIKQCETLRSLERYDELMKAYPILNKSLKAYKIREKLAFFEAKARGTVEDYTIYLQEYPSLTNPYRKQAIELSNKAGKQN